VYPNRRPFILTRSSFTGTGHYAAHWLGDNFSTWEQLRLSIPGVLQFQLAAYPFVGADICGFFDDADEELCARWMELGAFYPFARNHNDFESASQEPYLWSSVAEAGRKALKVRYALISYLYTLFYQAHIGSASTVWQPLFFEFPNDTTALDIDNQFMLGSSLLVTPVLHPGATRVRGYFPAAVWYDFYTQKRLETNEDSDKGAFVELDAPLTHIPVHIRGGSVIPLHDPALTTFETVQSAYTLVLALNEQGFAKGQVYFDDGESLDMKTYSLMQVRVYDFTKLTLYGSFGYQPLPPLKKIVCLSPVVWNAHTHSISMQIQNSKQIWFINKQTWSITIDQHRLVLTPPQPVVINANTTIEW